MKKEFVTLKKALPGFVAECTKVVNSENEKLMDVHVSDRRSLNYYLREAIELSLHIDNGDKILIPRSIQYVLQRAYKAIDMLLRGKFRDYYRVIFSDYRYCLLDIEGEDRYCDLSYLIFGVNLYIFEMLDEDNFNLFRLTESLWSKECQSNDIYKRLKNDEKLTDLANRKVWRLWTEEDDDKEVEDVEKENDDKNNDGKEEAGKEITIDESSPINTYFKILYSTLLREKMEKAVELCGDTKSHLAFLELVIEAKEYTLCISCHKLFLEVLDAMGIKKYDVKTHNCVKGKYENLINDKNWKRKDKIKYDAIKKIFDEKVLV